jgi:ABC-2 type transport system permease protein
MSAATRPLYWSLRRELWENRSLYLAPLAVASVVLFSFLVSMGRLPQKMRTLPGLAPAKQLLAVVTPYSLAASVILLTGFIVGSFYCLDALHSERRDRSILFWKSLPVSDRTTVLAKAAVPFVLLPMLSFAIALTTQLIMLMFSTVVLGASGVNPAALWSRLPLLTMAVVMFYGLAVHALWYAPIYSGLLLISVWAKRSVFLWAVLPAVTIQIIEKMAFGTSHFAALVKYRLLGAMAEAFAVDAMKGPITRLSQLDPARFLSASGLWVGLAFSAVFLMLAVRLRRNRGPV